MSASASTLTLAESVVKHIYVQDSSATVSSQLHDPVAAQIQTACQCVIHQDLYARLSGDFLPSSVHNCHILPKTNQCKEHHVKTTSDDTLLKMVSVRARVELIDAPPKTQAKRFFRLQTSRWNLTFAANFALYACMDVCMYEYIMYTWSTATCYPQARGHAHSRTAPRCASDATSDREPDQPNANQTRRDHCRP